MAEKIYYSYISWGIQPLPLDFEDKPNFPALKRTIARLRKYILNKENEEKEPATAKER